jgi:hypothetical protein
LRQPDKARPLKTLAATVLFLHANFIIPSKTLLSYATHYSSQTARDLFDLNEFCQRISCGSSKRLGLSFDRKLRRNQERQ